MSSRPLPSLLCLYVLAATACSGAGFDVGSSGGRETRYSGLSEEAAERRRLALDVPAGGRLVLAGFDGTLVVRARAGGDRGELVAELRVRAGDLETARKVLAELDFAVERDDGARVVRLVRPRGTARYDNLSRYELRIPEGVLLDVTDGRGGIEATGPFAAVRVVTEHGDVTVSDVAGDTDVTNHTGDVTLSGLNGRLASVDSGHGKVEVSRSAPQLLRIGHRAGGVRLWQVDAPRIEIENLHGPIALEGVSGDVTARTASGAVRGTDLSGTVALETSSGTVSLLGGRGKLSVRAPNGDVTVESAEGSLSALSTFGSILVEGRFADLRAVTESGDVQASLAPGTRPRTPFQLASASGDVTLAVPPELAFRLDAHTKRGEIETNLPLVIEASRASDGEVLRGDVRGGGPVMELRSSSGTLRVLDRSR